MLIRRRFVTQQIHIIRIIKDDGMGGICGNHGVEVKGTQNFGGET